MKQMLKDIRIEINEPIFIHYDKKIKVNMFKNPVLHSKTKKISMKYYMLREKVIEKEIILKYVSTKLHIVDIFTKALPKDTFEYL